MTAQPGTDRPPMCHGKPMVQRRAGKGQRTGGFFWGCATYPRCRRTIDIPSLAATPDPLAIAAPSTPETAPTLTVGQGAVIGVAGGSARRAYQRRKRRFDEGRAERLPAALSSAALLAILLFVVLDRAHSPFALPVAAGMALVTLLGVITPPSWVIAWITGARGEERTAEFLDSLVDRGFVVFHDRKIPLSMANIDHVVIGPPGVFVVETKNIEGKVRISGSEVRIGGHKVAVVEEVRREVQAVWNALGSFLEPRGLLVEAIVCAHRADLPLFWSSVRGIPIVSGRGLVRRLKKAPVRLTSDEVYELATIALKNLP